MDKSRFYTYLWLREVGTPYYVGKGRGQRAYDPHPRIGGTPPRERILIQYFPDEESALAAEKFLISFYGRKDLGTGILRNLTDGGDIGPTGVRHTEEWKRNFSAKMKGHPVSEKTRQKLRLLFIGKKLTPEQGEKRRALRGNPYPTWTAHHRKVMEALIPWNKGKKASEEARRNMSLAHRGKPRPWRVGVKHTPEVRQKLSQSHLGQIPWNKGKKGAQVAWNKGLKCPQIAIKLIGNQNGKGRSQPHAKPTGAAILYA